MGLWSTYIPKADQSRDIETHGIAHMRWACTSLSMFLQNSIRFLTVRDEVLSSNEGYHYVWTHAIAKAVVQHISREPQGRNHPPVTLELQSLVKNKILAQDAKLREKLSTLNWTLEDPAAIRLVYGDRPEETVWHFLILMDLFLLIRVDLAQYILQLAFLMLEYLVQVAQACCTVTIDIREWERLANNFKSMRNLAIERVKYLKGSSSSTNYGQKPFDFLTPETFEPDHTCKYFHGRSVW